MFYGITDLTTFILGTIFSHAALRPVWLKSVVVVTPFAALVVDIASWYFTKLYPPFAWVVIGSGLLMGLAFAFMWAVSMYQLWVFPSSRRVIEVTKPAGA